MLSRRIKQGPYNMFYKNKHYNDFCVLQFVQKHLHDALKNDIFQDINYVVDRVYPLTLPRLVK